MPETAAAPAIACALVVHGLGLEDGPGATIPATISTKHRKDGRTLVRILPDAPQHRRRYRTLAFIVTPPQLEGRAHNGK